MANVGLVVEDAGDAILAHAPAFAGCRPHGHIRRYCPNPRDTQPRAPRFGNVKVAEKLYFSTAVDSGPANAAPLPAPAALLTCPVALPAPTEPCLAPVPPVADPGG
jgi:hypothetical protein